MKDYFGVSMRMAYCSICGCDREVITITSVDKVYNLIKCMNCGLVFLNPEPPIGELEKIYLEERDFYFLRQNFYSVTRQLKYKIASWRFSGFGLKKTPLDISKRFIAWLIEKTSGHCTPYTMAVPLLMPKKAAILEIGYGNGAWLLGMKALGFSNLYGIDINEVAKEKLTEAKIQVRTGDILSVDFPAEYFDLIRLEFVLEHLSSPNERLSKIAQWLKSSGKIVMSLPNIESLTYDFFREFTVALQLPEHIYHYSYHTITMLADRCGLKVIEYRTMPAWNQFAASLQKYLGNINKANFFTNLMNRKLICIIIQPIYSFLVSKNKGDFMSLVMGKK
jgi:SAM-dependent methyltransferase